MEGKGFGKIGSVVVRAIFAISHALAGGSRSVPESFFMYYVGRSVSLSIKRGLLLQSFPALAKKPVPSSLPSTHNDDDDDDDAQMRYKVQYRVSE